MALICTEKAYRQAEEVYKIQKYWDLSNFAFGFGRSCNYRITGGKLVWFDS